MFVDALYFPGDGPLTVFAPTNEAIEALPADMVSSLMEDTEMLKQVLLFHVVAGEITSSMADNNIQLPSVAGPPLLVNLYLKSKLNGLLLTADFDPEAGLPDVGHGTDIKSSLEYGVHD